MLLGADLMDGELHQLIETTVRAVGCRSVVCAPCCLNAGRSGCRTCRRPVGRWCWCVVEAGLALPRRGLCDTDVDRGEPGGGARAWLTEGAQRNACRRVRRDGHSVATVARNLGVGSSTVMTAVRDYGGPLVDDPDRIGDVNAQSRRAVKPR